MTMEACLIGKKRNNNIVLEKKKKKNKKEKCITRRRTKRCNPPPTNILQNLFMACTQVFKGPSTEVGSVPPPQHVQNLCHILDSMKPEDVGLSRDLLFFKSNNIPKETPSITYTTIYKCNSFTMHLFFIPPLGVIPLHNHPGMTVFSKLLLGTMHIKSYDWVDPIKREDSISSKLKLASLKADTIFSAPCNTSVLYPTSGGNIHEFTAITPCAVLDVVGPPYSKQDGRDCSYYRDFPCYLSTDGAKDEEALEKKERNSYGWLEEIEMPKDLKMEGIEYLGPQVIEPPFGLL